MKIGIENETALGEPAGIEWLILRQQTDTNFELVVDTNGLGSAPKIAPNILPHVKSVRSLWELARSCE